MNEQDQKENQYPPAKKAGEKVHRGGAHLDQEIKTEIDEIEDLTDEVDAMNIEEAPKSELRDELLDLKTELEESKEQLLRAYSEMENIRRRTQQDIARAHRYALEKFLEELIPTIDSLEKAVESIPLDDQDNPVFAGVKLTLQLLLKSFEKFSIKRVNPLNQIFDPQYHEAISTQVDSEVKPNTILSVLQKGYLLNDRVVRAALVIVSK